MKLHYTIDIQDPSTHYVSISLMMQWPSKSESFEIFLPNWSPNPKYKGPKKPPLMWPPTPVDDRVLEGWDIVPLRPRRSKVPPKII